MITGELALGNLTDLVSVLAVAQSSTQKGGNHRLLSADLANGNHKFTHLPDSQGSVFFYFVYSAKRIEIISALVFSSRHNDGWYTISYFRNARWLTSVQIGQLLLYRMLLHHRERYFAIHASAHELILDKFHFRPLEKQNLTSDQRLHIARAFSVSHSHAEILIWQPCLLAEWESIQQYINKLSLPLEKQLDEELSIFESRKG